MNIRHSSLSEIYPLPPQQLRFMGENDRQYMKIGDLNVQMLQQALPIEKIHCFLDIGCCNGRLAHALLRSGNFEGTYYGLNILPAHITWCQHHLSRQGLFHFKHLDIHNDRYNPSRKYHVTDMDFSSMPKVDIVSFYSVFTHLYEDDIRFYLKSAASMLTPHGKVLCTAFLHNDSSAAGEAAGKSRYPMPHHLNEYTRYYNEKDPLHAISFDESAFFDMIFESGLRTEQILLGGWCGRTVTTKLDPFQDLIIATLTE